MVSRVSLELRPTGRPTGFAWRRTGCLAALAVDLFAGLILEIAILIYLHGFIGASLAGLAPTRFP